jgi:thiamine transport system permease protein
MSRRASRIALTAFPLAFLGYFFVYPVIRIITEGLAPGGTLDLSPLRDVLTDSGLRGVAWFTTWQAAASTLLTLAVGLPAAYVMARFDFRGKPFVRSAIVIPFVLPTLVVGTAFLSLIGPNGALGLRLDRTVWAILAAHVFFNYAVVVRTVGGLWEHIDPRMEEAARMLGASRREAFRRVTLPLLRPAIAAAAAIVFLFSFTSFGIILVLGGPRLATLEVEIYRRATTLFDLPIAAALAVAQLVGVVAILWLYSRYQQRRALQLSLRPAAEAARAPQTPGQRWMLRANLAFMAVFLGGPLAVLVVRSLRMAGGFGIEAYRRLGDETQSALFVPPAEAVRNSVLFATATVVIALAVGLAAAVVIAQRRSGANPWFDALLILPLGTSAVTIGFGFLIALGEPIDLRASLLLVPVAHALVAIPFVVSAIVPVMRSVQHRLREAAAVLGASPSRTWREIDLPIVGRAALAAAAFAFAVSLGEFGATAFIARPDAPTMPLAIFRLLGQPGAATFGQAMALSVILMLLTATAVSAIDRTRVGGVGTF